MIAGIVLAAGGSRRFGRLKQLTHLSGRPLIEYPLRALAAASIDRRIVVLGRATERILAEVDLHGADPVICARWREGQAFSLRTGIAATVDADAVVVCLGDQPLIAPIAIERVLAAWSESAAPAARAAYAEGPGHPVVIGRQLFEAIGSLTGDAGARALLEREGVRTVLCDDLGAPGDVDTVGDLREVQRRLLVRPPTPPLQS